MPGFVVRGTITYPFEYFVDTEEHTADSIVAQFGSAYNFARYAFQDTTDDVWVLDTDASLSVQSVTSDGSD